VLDENFRAGIVGRAGFVFGHDGRYVIMADGAKAR
jgi:hypothetical protein